MFYKIYLPTYYRYSERKFDRFHSKFAVSKKKIEQILLG